MNMINMTIMNMKMRNMNVMNMDIMKMLRESRPLLPQREGSRPSNPSAAMFPLGWGHQQECHFKENGYPSYCYKM
jgi:hypothetical protein